MNLRFQGRFGNQLFQYCYARAFCEEAGLELRTEPWIGESLFEIKHERVEDGEPNNFPGYYQTQADLIYSRVKARLWCTWRPQVLQKLYESVLLNPLVEARAHLRRGDYDQTVYVTVTIKSYLDAAAKIHKKLSFVQEETPCLIPGLPCFLPDFFRLMRASILFRANSTFSWWAHVLGREDQRIFSPVIEGLPPGPQYCEFIEGNWPRFANLPNVTDLHLP